MVGIANQTLTVTASLRSCISGNYSARYQLLVRHYRLQLLSDICTMIPHLFLSNNRRPHSDEPVDMLNRQVARVDLKFSISDLDGSAEAAFAMPQPSVGPQFLTVGI